MIRVLKTSGYGLRDSFYRTAQAISETLSQESKEKKLLDGFLSGRERVISQIKESKDVLEQGILF